MARVPLDIACKVASVKPATIRKWVSRGKIGRYDDGYDLTELMLWIDQIRDTRMIELANGIHPRHARTTTLDAP